MPLVYLNRQLQVEAIAETQGAEDGDGVINIVVLQADDRQFGLVVDAIHDTEEIVVKPLQKQLKGIGVFAGATIMGDGKVALILDVLGSGPAGQCRLRSARTRPERENGRRCRADRRSPDRAALCHQPDGRPHGHSAVAVARLEEFPRRALEEVGPQDVVQYRDEILPLIHVSQLLRPAPRASKEGINTADNVP